MKREAVNAAKVVKAEPVVEPGIAVTRTEFLTAGKAWPLTVPDARVGCVGPGVLWVLSNGTKYGLNGLATRAAGYQDLQAIRAVDQKAMDELQQISRRKRTTPWYIDTTDLMMRAQASCGVP